MPENSLVDTKFVNKLSRASTLNRQKIPKRKTEKMWTFSLLSLAIISQSLAQFSTEGTFQNLKILIFLVNSNDHNLFPDIFFRPILKKRQFDDIFREMNGAIFTDFCLFNLKAIAFKLADNKLKSSFI